MASALSDISDVLTTVVEIITGNSILFTCFAGGLVIVGAKVFKRIKNAVK